MKNFQYKPFHFIVITFVVTYLCWTAAAIVSGQPGGGDTFLIFLIPGMMTPTFAALWMIRSSKSKELWNSFKERIFNLRLIKPLSFIPALLIVPAAILIATAISVATGGDPTQFQIADGFSFTVGMVPTLMIVILASIFEELGWRGYAVDSLSSRYTYFKATLIFAIVWSLWHIPLFFINSMYQNEIAIENIWYAVNFILSIIPLAFIINWVYRINRNSITAIILFHIFVNLSQEALNITQTTKCIESGVLVVFAVIIVEMNKSLFFDKQKGL